MAAPIGCDFSCLCQQNWHWPRNAANPPAFPHVICESKEIKSLSSKLQAVAVLDEISLIVKWTDQFAVAPRELRQATHYIIKYDRVSREVTVDWYIAPRLAVSSYNEAEFLDFKMDRKNIVLVEVDKIENLKEAYPNYFGDVQLFRKQLVEIVKRKVGARIYFASARNRSSATQGKPKFGVAS